MEPGSSDAAAPEIPPTHLPLRPLPHHPLPRRLPFSTPNPNPPVDAAAEAAAEPVGTGMASASTSTLPAALERLRGTSALPETMASRARACLTRKGPRSRLLGVSTPSRSGAAADLSFVGLAREEGDGNGGARRHGSNEQARALVHNAQLHLHTVHD